MRTERLLEPVWRRLKNMPSIDQAKDRQHQGRLSAHQTDLQQTSIQQTPPRPSSAYTPATIHPAGRPGRHAGVFDMGRKSPTSRDLECRSTDIQRAHGWRTVKRPGVDYFLSYLSQFYEIVLFTSQPTYVSQPPKPTAFHSSENLVEQLFKCKAMRMLR